jgi:glycine betaine catabolism B
MGTFHHNPLFHGDDVVFLAGGSGVVPAMSMIRDVIDNNLDVRMHLVYGSRSADDIIFKNELDTEHPNIKVDHVIGGLLTADIISSLTGRLNNRMVYVCGPQAMYPHALEQLTALGHPRRRIRFEANGAPNDPTRQPHWPDVDPTEHVTVTARGRTFTTPRNRPLLDALENNGVTVESACRSGECSLCRVRVCRGTVHNAEEAQLRMTDAAFGYTHSCVAYPMTDVDIDV